MKRAYFTTLEQAQKCRDMVYRCGLSYWPRLSGYTTGGYIVSWSTR